MPTVRVNACIVGGGPAGLVLGLLLAKRGAEVLVLEGHENFDREYRGEVLQPSTAALLDELGLLEYVLRQPHSTFDTGKVRLNGKEVGEFSFRKISPEYPYAIWMPQPVFLAAMLRKAQPFPTFQCWMGGRVSGLVEEEGRVAGVRGLLHGKEPFEVRADVVVGADGRHSAVARMAGFKAAYEHHDFDLIWFTVERPPDWPNTLHVCLGDDVGGLILPKFPRHLQVGLALPTGEWRAWRQEGVATVAERVRRFDPVLSRFADSLADFTPFFPLDGLIRLEEDWARDGLILIGDAAHTMSPAGAIGVNVAIATAVVAAQELHPRLGGGPIPRAVLHRVQEIREADVRELHRLQLGAQQLMLGQKRRHPVVRWLLPRLLPMLLHSPLVPRLQRRVFFGVPLPPLDPTFRFPKEPATGAVEGEAIA